VSQANENERLTTKEAARALGMSVSWLEKSRCAGMNGPPYRKIGRSVRYVRGELLAWDAQRKRELVDLSA
jgi:predicted DNA-binding transcriptional regulator AlpA